MSPGESASHSPAPAIRVRGLRLEVGGRWVLDGLDLDVQRGEILGLVGETGAGKSMLMRAILGLVPVTEGCIEVLGYDIGRIDAEARRALERRRGVLFQDGALFGGLSVRENVEVPMREQLALPADLRAPLVRLKLAMVGLGPEAGDKAPHELSGGMRKRAGLARALAIDPELLFLDEPTAGLDPLGADTFDALIADLSRSLALTTLMVTHDIDTIFHVCDRVAVLAEGRIVQTGAPHDIQAAPAHPWAAAYFQSRRAERARRRRGARAGA